jgi:ectoine hydroxylase-related dioxygenase (phytanoyl-CoA dioxygenase family)
VNKPLKELRISNDAVNDPEELQRRIEDEGYLFFKQLQDPDKLLKMRREMLTVIQEGGWLIKGTDPMDAIADVSKQCTEGVSEYVDVYKNVQKLESFHDAGHWPEVTEVVDRIMGRPAMPHAQKIARIWFPQYTEFTTPTHQDFVHFQGCYENLTLWAPIGDCPIELGGLAVLPGSHKVGKILDHHFALGAGNLNVDVDGDAENYEELTAGWHSTDYEVGDTLFFPALTVHKALPNVTDDKLRVSLDNRYHPIGEPIAEHMLEPHLSSNISSGSSSSGGLSWEDIYEGWDSDQHQYYWRKYNNPTVATISEYGEAAFVEAMDMARDGNEHALFHLRRSIRNDPESPSAIAAADLLGSMGVSTSL